MFDDQPPAVQGKTLSPTFRIQRSEGLVAAVAPIADDRIAAAGKLQATFLAGGELTFCGHHANRFATRLMETAAMIMVELGFGWRGATLQAALQLD